ncbi:hypothetical protein EDD11_008340 [Mortierella claussenii]|nr:hypothetical protein EDD11_008340 [Mortierella claussenii]
MRSRQRPASVWTITTSAYSKRLSDFRQSMDDMPIDSYSQPKPFCSRTLDAPWNQSRSSENATSRKMLPQDRRGVADDIWQEYRRLCKVQPRPKKNLFSTPASISSTVSTTAPTTAPTAAPTTAPTTAPTPTPAPASILDPGSPSITSSSPVALVEPMLVDKELQLTRQDYTKLLRILRYSANWTEGAHRILSVHQDMRRKGIRDTRKVLEIVAQAQILLRPASLLEDILQLHTEATTPSSASSSSQYPVLTMGSKEHKRLLWTMAHAFTVNQFTTEGILFLDQLPSFCKSSTTRKEPIDALGTAVDEGLELELTQEQVQAQEEEGRQFIHSLYRKLYLQHFKSSQAPSTTSSQALPLGSLSAKQLEVIQQFTALRSLPTRDSVVRLLSLPELSPSGHASVPLQLLARAVAGMLIKTGDSQTVIPLLQSLLLSCQIEEATRVLDLMLQHGMDPEVDQIRLHLLHSFDASRDQQDLKSVLKQWDVITEKRIARPVQPEQDSQEGSQSVAAQYSNLIHQSILNNDLQGALKAAQYIAEQGWIAQGLDFRRLNSVMINHSHSSSQASSYFSAFSASDYPLYLQIRYTLGGSIAPDLHTYRRLVFAACRRSDLLTALTLFKLVRTRHPSWVLDLTIYNAIISTAAAIEEIKVAEKTFACLIQDGLIPDHYSFHGLLNGYSNVGDLEAAVMIPEQMLKYKLQPTTKTFNLVMKSYLSSGRGKGDMATTRKLFKVMKQSSTETSASTSSEQQKRQQQSIAPDLVTFNQLLEGYRRIGNTMWFDAYFDKHFGNKGRPPSDSDPVAEQEEKKEAATTVRAEKSDDRSLLIQLKYSLNLPNVNLATVQELWRAIEPKFRPSSASPSLDIDSTTSKDNGGDPQHLINRDGESTLPPTHVPFPRLLDSVWMPATDEEHFRFTTLILFRNAFRTRGDVVGVKTMDGLLSKFFPHHPMGQAVLRRRMVKSMRYETRIKNKEKKKGHGR